MAESQYHFSHLLIRDRVENRVFTRRGGGDRKVRGVERRTHGGRIRGEALRALDDQDQARAEVDHRELESLGVVISLEGAAGFRLRLESLDQRGTHRGKRRQRWILLSVKPETQDSGEIAQVWVSDMYRKSFLELFRRFLEEEDRRSGKPKNQGLVANIDKIRASVLLDLWQSDGAPPTGRNWWEIWLRPEEDAIELVGRFATAVGGRIARRRLQLDSRHVVWIEATWRDLERLPHTAVPVTEIRLPQFVDVVSDLSSAEQADYVTDLADRITPAAASAPAVCLLDSGARRTHVLLEGSLSQSDMHTVVRGHTGDDDGHGTKMCGLALFGPLDGLLEGSERVELTHRLESVKLLSDRDPHDPQAYGLVTAEAVARPEVAARRRRAFCMPITATPDRAGEPSLWSASVDALAVGAGISSSADGIDLLGVPNDDEKRLIVVCVGNIHSPNNSAYLDECDLSPIEDPAQAWNALVVGAYTGKTDVPTDPSYEGWTAVAEAGELSPFSRTSVIAGGQQWPIRPDICMEGGNVLTDGAGNYHTNHPHLSLLTADHRRDDLLGTANATSAATAQAARLATRAMAVYPGYWPETIRGLLPHAAEWTPAMRERFRGESKKKARAMLLRRYGWGVPTEAAVEWSTQTAVTMVVQDHFVPFTGTDHKMREFRLHELPWPREALQALSDAEVELRVTLSYFIEPSGSRRGWRGRYAYASHGIRFELRRPNETTAEFVKRVNREAGREEDGTSSSRGDDDQWMIGPNQRNRGSLHQDIWTGYGAELATCGALAVHAVGGWWKNNRRTDRVDLPIRYGLLVSLRTPATEVDLYEPIAAEIGVPVTPVQIEI